MGPDFFSFDLRLNREIPLTETWTLGLIAEAFNLLNRTNFKHINSTVGDVSIDELPSRLVGRRGTGHRTLLLHGGIRSAAIPVVDPA